MKFQLIISDLQVLLQNMITKGKKKMDFLTLYPRGQNFILVKSKKNS